MSELTVDITIEVSGRGMAVHAEQTFLLPERVYLRLERTTMDVLLQRAIDEYYELVEERRKARLSKKGDHEAWGTAAAQ